MGKVSGTPPQVRLYEEAHSEVVRKLGEIGEKNPNIRMVRVAGPWIPEEGYQPGEPCLTDDKISGIYRGCPCVHVGIITNQNIRQQYLKPMEKGKEIQNAIRDLEKKYGINMMVSVTPTRELSGETLSLEEAEAYMFGDKTRLFTIASRKYD